MKTNGFLTYIKYSATGLISAAVDNLTYFLLNRAEVSDLWALTAARIVSLIANYFMLKSAVFHDSKRQDSFPRYVLLVAVVAVFDYFLLTRLRPLLPLPPLVIKMSIELVMQILNFFITRFFVFGQKRESVHEEE